MCKRELTEAELAQVNGGVTYNNGLFYWGGAQPGYLGFGTGMPTGDVAVFLQGQQGQQNPTVQIGVPDPRDTPGTQL